MPESGIAHVVVELDGGLAAVSGSLPSESWVLVTFSMRASNSGVANEPCAGFSVYHVASIAMLSPIAMQPNGSSLMPRNPSSRLTSFLSRYVASSQITNSGSMPISLRDPPMASARVLVAGVHVVRVFKSVGVASLFEKLFGLLRVVLVSLEGIVVAV